MRKAFSKRCTAILVCCIPLLSACTDKDPYTDTAATHPVSAAPAAVPAPVQPITPQPIPAGYDFPADRAVVQAYTDANDTTKMRVHGWNIWAGMTANSSFTYAGKVLPIWETWLATSQVFVAGGQSVQALTPGMKPVREFHDPSQFTHNFKFKKSSEQTTDNAAFVGFNKFDPTMVSYLLEGHPGPGNTEVLYRYTQTPSLTALNNAWPSKTPILDRKVVDAPNTAIELKPVMMFVAQKGMTAIPFWQGPTASTAKDCGDPSNYLNCHPDPTTWTHCVLIDPSVTTSTLTAATAQQFASADKSQAPACTDAANAQYGGINMLYNFAMDADEAAAFNAAQQPAVNAVAGDYMVLLAMHVNTKEIVDWTWQTFWWQGGQATPNDFPGGNANITSNISAPWSNYNMCTAYSQTTKPDNKGTMRVCFNPYLETSPGIPDGLNSNCVSCHGTATVNTPSTGGYPANYKEPINFGDPKYFADSTKTDFSWAIPVNATK